MSDIATPATLSILHLEDSKVDHELAKFALRKSGVSFDMRRVETLTEFRRQFQLSHHDVVLADYRLPGFTAMDAWEFLQTQVEQPPFIILSGAIGEPAAVDAIRRGVSDYLLKDSMGKLAHVIQRAIEIRDTRLAREHADQELAASERRLAELTEHLQSSIEQERASIAREIHDDIGGALAAIRFDLAWIERHSADSALLGHVQAATEMLQHAVGASQRIMMDLRPAVLDQGLVAALQWLASGFEKRTGVRAQLRSAQDRLELDKDIQLAAYRTAQEALTNVAKHAGATSAVIELSTAKGVLTLEISDNGAGLTRQQLDKPKAFGIKGLHERARTVNGWLDVSSQPGRGTSVILSIPLHSGHAADATVDT